jgi:hypothetical protein
MRGPGRPELPRSEARTVKITVYVRDVDERFFARLADANGKRLSGWAYEALLRAAQEEARRLGMPVPLEVRVRVRPAGVPRTEKQKRKPRRQRGAR